jgi:hypothetical protein
VAALKKHPVFYSSSEEDPRNTPEAIKLLPRINSSAPKTEVQSGCGLMKLEKSGA